MFKNMLSLITISDLVSLLNLISGFLFLIFLNPVFLVFAIFFDYLDGFVARLTNTSSDFGKELDSLCDVVSFGVAPVYFVISGNLNILNIVFSSFFLICGILRLARYNISNLKGEYIGLPIPIAAFVLVVQHILFKNFYFDIIFLFFLGLLMICDMKFKKF